MADGQARRGRAAAALPSLEPKHTCHICGHHGHGMAFLFKQWMCKDRVECYQRVRVGHV